MTKFGLVGSMLLGLAATPSAAAYVLDQNNLVDVTAGRLTISGLGGGSGIVRQAQTVTAGQFGILAEIDLQILRDSEFPGFSKPFEVAVYNGDLAVNPAAGVIYRQSFAYSAATSQSDALAGDVFAVDILSASYRVRPGQIFTIAVAADNSSPFSFIGIANGYQALGTTTYLQYSSGVNTIYFADGSSQASLYDRGFRTFVQQSSVPEPAAWTMMIGGFAFLGIRKRRQMAVV